MYLLIDLTYICPPLFTFVAPQEDEDQVVQDAADAAGALMYVLILILTIVIGINKFHIIALNTSKTSKNKIEYRCFKVFNLISNTLVLYMLPYSAYPLFDTVIVYFF